MLIHAMMCGLMVLGSVYADEPKPIDGDGLIAIIKSLPTKRSPYGGEAHVQGLLDTEKLLTQAVKNLGYEPTLQRVAWSRRDDPAAREWHNIIFEIKGREKPGEVIVVSAHVDAVKDAPGADDDASGVAAVLEMARVLHGVPLKRTVRFALFNLEEVGLVGSTQYVESIRDRVRKGEETIAGMVSLEMLGYYRDEPGSQKNMFKAVQGLTVPDRGDFIGMGTTLQSRRFVRTLEAQMKLAEPEMKIVVFDYLPFAPPDLLRSDHAAFLLAGMPGVMVTDTANFRNPNYHKPTDSVETLDRVRYARTVRAMTEAIRAIACPVGKAEAAEPPEPAPLAGMEAPADQAK